MNTKDSRMFSVKWLNKPNPNGVRPNSEMIPDYGEQDISLVTYTNNMPMGNIQSNRQPYAVQHLYTKYGELNTGLGTNLGVNQ